MKVAVFTNIKTSSDVLIFAVKGKGNKKDDILGWKHYFRRRSIWDYAVSIVDIDEKNGLVIESSLDASCSGRNVTDWFGVI